MVAIAADRYAELLDLDAIRTALAAKSLRHFVREAWHVVEPGRELVPGFYVDAICDHLQAVVAGEIKRLVITLPPGFLKSTIVSVLFPAWLWVDQPEFRFLTTSHDADLAMRDAVRSRRVITSDWYQARWGDRFAMTTDQNVKTRYENDRAGHRISLGTGSGITGKRGDLIICLRYNVPIQTDRGLIPIGDVVEQRLPVKVLAYDHNTEYPVWRQIEAYEKNPGRASVRVTFSNGATIECTNDHPVYVVGRGYVPAGALHDGDEVLTSEVYMRGLRQGVRPIAGARRARREARPVLFASLSRRCAQWFAESGMERGIGHADLCVVPAIVPSQAISGETGEVLLRHMPPTVESCDADATAQAGDARLRLLRSGVQPSTIVGLCDELLFATMRQFLPLAADQRGGQRALGARPRTEAVFADVSPHRAENTGARRTSLPALREDARAERQGTRRSSHRLRQNERRSGESHQSMPAVSSPDSWAVIARAPRMGHATVRTVERIDAPEHTYNVRVADHHNYFASGVLVHNCDDPHDASDAHSATALAATVRWWNEDVPSRLNDPKNGAKVIIQQRIHVNDLAGVVIEQGYDHLNLPMEYDPAHVSLPTAIGWTDPRTEAGALLDPVRYGAAEVAEKRRELGSQAYSAQYQQQPTTTEGGIVKRHWWRFWQRDGDDLPPVLTQDASGRAVAHAVVTLPALSHRAALSWDMSFKKTTDGSYVVGLAGQTWGPNVYITDRYRARASFGDSIAAILAMRAAHPHITTTLVEDAANGPAVIDTLNQHISGIVPVRPDGSKEARLTAITPLIEAGNVVLPHPRLAPWVDEFVDELSSFPNGAHDDQVDSLSMLCRYLMPAGVNTDTAALMDRLFAAPFAER